MTQASITKCKHGHETHCKHGHEFSEKNTRIEVREVRDGVPIYRRACRECARLRTRAHQLPAKLARRAQKERDLEQFIARVSNVELAWAAGLFEGEGTITFASGGKGSPYIRTLVSVTSTDRQIVEFFHSRWPARTLTSRTPQTSPNARLAWTWALYDRRAVVFLRQMRPYTRTTRVLGKIDLVLDAFDHRMNGKRPTDGSGLSMEEYHALQQEYKSRMRALNKRGR